MIKDLIALTKPRLNFLVLLSALAGYGMGHQGPLVLLNFFEFGAAAFVLAGSASAVNMWMERDRDALMRRTADRPLASGRMRPAWGLVFGILLMLGSMLWLASRVNGLTACLGAATWASYLLVYTPLKRVTSLATWVGAIPGALPPVMGWTAAAGTLSEPALALFAVLFFWQIPHFLAIAVMYQDEYKTAGFKVMPIEQGIEATGRQMVIYALVLIPVTLWIYQLGLSGRLYFYAAILLGLAYAGVAMHAAGFSGRQRARRLLLASVFYLPLLFSVMLANRIS